jgi:hypothetical protein
VIEYAWRKKGNKFINKPSTFGISFTCFLLGWPLDVLRQHDDAKAILFLSKKREPASIHSQCNHCIATIPSQQTCDEQIPCIFRYASIASVESPPISQQRVWESQQEGVSRIALTVKEEQIDILTIRLLTLLTKVLMAGHFFLKKMETVQVLAGMSHYPQTFLSV